MWESLLTPSADEAASGYGHLAETIELPADKMWVAFELRPEAKFSDGTPVTAEDVAWTYRTLLEQGRPSFRIQMADVKDVVVESPRRVVFHFKSNENRELPLILGGLPVLPKHFFDGRDFTKPLTDPPIGSGPYRIASFELGRSVTYERRPDWWAANMPTGKGTNNFDRVRIEYFRDSTVAMEAFKAGQIDLRSENISKNWATAYDFPAVTSGLVIKRDFKHHLPTGMQGYAMNTRRPVFANPLVRQAMAEAFDFEWANKNLFYGSYTRTLSYFSNSDLASSGIPQGDELKLLEPYRKELPPALFTEPFKLPVTDGSGNNREQLRHALELLEQAGWSVKGMKLVDKNGTADEFHHPARRSVAGTRGAALCAVAAEARHRCAGAHGRSGAVPASDRRLRLRHDHDDLSGERHSGQRTARLLHLRGEQGAGQLQRAGHLRSGGRCAGRARSSPRRTARR